MSINQILDKARAVTSDEASSPDAKPPKRKGVWDQLETFVDKDSGLGVVITERVKGRPAYSISIVHFDHLGGNKFIQVPLQGAKRPLKEILYLLGEKAEAFIEERRKKDRADRPQRKPRPKEKRAKTTPVKGLSDLAKQDAEKKGKADEYVGKTARKKNRK